jgi:GntR family transcriptional regulator/MocR family aminotransferase
VPVTVAEDAFFIDRDTSEGLQMQLRQNVASSILSGRLRVGDRLPSSRRLANHLRISRITVTLAYQELAADGYLESRNRSGYYVAQTAPVARIQQTTRQTGGTQLDWKDRFARRKRDAPMVHKTVNWREFEYPFVYGQADPQIFNHSAWRSCAHRALGRRDFHALANDYVADDDPELIDFISRHTLPRRGIAASSDEILITMGAQNALWIVSHLLLDQNRRAAIEDPGYPGLRDVLMQTGCEISAVSVDNDGLPPEDIPNGTDVVFATPSHQAPTTVTMPMTRRRALLDRAAVQDFVIVEDDYEFELSFLKPPHPALKSMDQNDRVIYIGSFSKSLFPGLRLGYLVAPRDFIAEARALRTSMLRHPPGHIQRTTAYFLGLGHYDALIRRMRDHFQERREIVMRSIEQTGLEAVHSSVFGGTSVWMKAPKSVDANLLADKVRKSGVLMEPGGPFFADQSKPVPHYRIAYSSISKDKIPKGLDILASQIATLA